MEVACSRSTNLRVPPEYAKSPAPSGRTRKGSVGRTDRRGPTGSVSVDWKMAAKRVSPPSMTSSYTTSAACSPDWGRAGCSFSILTTSAGRAARPASSTGMPVRGNTGAAGTEDEDDEDEDGGMVGAARTTFLGEEEQAAAARQATSVVPRSQRRV